MCYYVSLNDESILMQLATNVIKCFSIVNYYLLYVFEVLYSTRFLDGGTSIFVFYCKTIFVCKNYAKNSCMKSFERSEFFNRAVSLFCKSYKNVFA